MNIHVSFVFRFVALTFIGLFQCTGCGPHRLSTIEHPEMAIVKVVSESTDHAVRTEGTGFLVSADGFLVTSLHVIQAREQIVVTQPGGRLARALLVEQDAEGDVALLKIAGEKLPYLQLKEVDAEPGTHLRVVSRSGITHGLFDHWENFGRDIDMNAPVTSMDAGSPLLIDDGRVIGVAIGSFAGNPGEYRATPIWHVLKMMPKLLETN